MDQKEWFLTKKGFDLTFPHLEIGPWNLRGYSLLHQRHSGLKKRNIHFSIISRNLNQKQQQMFLTGDNFVFVPWKFAEVNKGLSNLQERQTGPRIFVFWNKWLNLCLFNSMYLRKFYIILFKKTPFISRNFYDIWQL